MVEVNFKKIESKWQKKWEEEKIFEAKEDSKKEKYYVLEMFAYPSGTGIHIGHAFNYTMGDISSRFKLMQGFNVLHPTGFDSLGLPAENAAIKDGSHPEEYTNKAIKNFIKQQKGLGLTYDWQRMVNTADPGYYKWDQWIFLKMLEKGLAYQKEAVVNWCPSCKTVLANEQAQSGKCERCDTKVEIKSLKQWFLKITDYADELLRDHKKLNWPEKTIAMQKNWIGKSHGIEIDFEIAPNKLPAEGDKSWPIFTTRPDTLFGVTFMVVSAQHLRLNELVTEEQEKEVAKFLKKLKSVSEKDLGDLEKEGVFTGSYAINPATNKEIPIYAGNFVVADYGSGMVMAVPAHDQRDFEFAKKYKLEIKQVIKGDVAKDRAYTNSGKLMNSESFNGMENQEAKEKITEWLKEKRKAKKVINYKLRDWGISRQRYWGTPIPIVYCDSCGVVPVHEKDLPIKLPKNVKFGKGNPLEGNEKWIKTKCPKCKKEARRETDTMDTFVNSSWYFLRYCDPQNNREIFDKKKAKYWMPVDLYIGGAEHACMHLIYSRFYTKFLADLGVINFREPAPRLFHQGMINDEKGEKMSKSKGNVVEPLETMEKYGVDTTRYFLISVASPDKGFNWSEKGIQGSARFIKKIFEIFENIKIGKDTLGMAVRINQSIKNIGEQIENLQFRKSSIELRELFDMIADEGEVSKETLESSLKLLNPFCPHITEELWAGLGNEGFISVAEWPTVDKSMLKDNSTEKDLNSKIIAQIKPILEKFQDKKKAYVYVMPFEKEKVDPAAISEAIEKEVEVWATNEKEKVDPENKAKKARPGMPGIYLE
ncbi:leucine--tRNA ligase [Candidatus Pacearchaeota archaeon]|nr:leucine--tRNA ligase [Candidatus Pacearchaeota archaeon]